MRLHMEANKARVTSELPKKIMVELGGGLKDLSLLVLF